MARHEFSTGVVSAFQTAGYGPASWISRLEEMDDGALLEDFIDGALA
eukprot:COSAG05_NODE_8028_length_744_cov_1.003101_1_plen_46_part_10